MCCPLLAQTCTDAPWPADTAWGNTWANAPCRVRPAKAGNPVPVLGFAVGSVLLLVDSLDAVTPLSGALSARQRYPHSALLTVNGGITNGVTPSTDTCVNTVLGNYLSGGILPPRKTGNVSDAECAAPPGLLVGAASVSGLDQICQG